MRQILVIAADNVRSLYHERLIFGLLLLAVLLTVVFSVLVAETQDTLFPAADMAAEARDRGMTGEEIAAMQRGTELGQSMLMGGYFWFSGLTATVVAIFLCATAAAADIRRGTIYTVLSRPITRAQFLLGKYAGAVLVLFCYSVLTGVATYVFSRVNGLDVSTAVQFAPLFMFLRALMAGSAALLLSLFMHPLLAGIVAFFASAGYFSSPNPLYFVLPSYDRFNVFQLIMSGRLLPADDVLMLTLYALDVSAILVLLALWRFRRRQLL